MYLEVTPSGSKLWRLKFRQANGSESRLAFGTYPEVSLLEAREKRVEARKQIAQGIDPGQARRKAKEVAASASANTFEKIAREWHANRLSAWSASTAKETVNRLCAEPKVQTKKSRSR